MFGNITIDINSLRQQLSSVALGIQTHRTSKKLCDFVIKLFCSLKPFKFKKGSETYSLLIILYQ